MQTVKLGKIFFGDVDGDSEAKRKNFDELFYGDKDIYDQLIEENKFLIVGRKGTGKSFLGNYLKNKVIAKGKFYQSKIYKGKDLNLYRLIKLGEFDIDTKQGELIWEYILFSILADLSLQDKSVLMYIPFSNKNKLRKFLRDKENEFKLTKINRSRENGIKVKGKQKEQELGAEAKEKEDLTYELKKYYEKLPKLKKLTTQALKKSNIVLIIDDLDSLNISTRMNTNYSQCIANLINVTKEINIELENIKGGKNKIIILLRDDILEYLNDNDSNINKSISNKYIKLDWWIKDEDKKTFEHPLIQMILLKVKKSTPEYYTMKDEELYELLFPKEIEGKEMISFLLEYSFGRPRDVIQFLTIIKDKDKGKKSFEAKSFKKYKKDYSEAFYRELKNEISIHEESEMLRNTIKLIQDFKRINFSYEKINEYYNSNKDNYPHIKDLKEALCYMYKLGVVGNTWSIPCKSQEGKTRYRVSWSYREDNGVDLNLSKNITVHKGLRRAFKLY